MFYDQEYSLLMINFCFVKIAATYLVLRYIPLKESTITHLIDRSPHDFEIGCQHSSEQIIEVNSNDIGL